MRGSAADTGNGRTHQIQYPATKLLTPAEEFELVSQLGDLRAQMQKLLAPMLAKAPTDMRLDHFDQIAAYYTQQRESLRKTLTSRVDRLLASYRTIKHRLVLANMPWVTKLARGQRQTAISEEDLLQEGVCGLLKAIDRFEAERGLRLMTYATWYIREAMQQIRARQSHLIAISSHDQTLLGQLEQKQSEFQHAHTRMPNEKELGNGLRGTPRFLQQLQSATRPAVSLERSASDGTIPIPVDDPIPEFDRQEEMQSQVQQLLDALPQRERIVVSRRFGLAGQEPTSLEDLGDDLHVSTERVRQLQRQAIRRLQKMVADKQLVVKTAI